MKTKCAWCNTENETGQKICRACGLPVSKRPAPLDDLGSSGAELLASDDAPRRLWPIALVVTALMAVLATGGWFLWQHYERERATREQRAAEAQKLKEAEAKRQRAEQARQSIPETVARARDEMKQGRFETGLALVNNLLLDVDSPELREARVDLLNNSGRWNEAYLELLTLLKLEPGKAYLHSAAGLFARNVKGNKEAIPHYEQAARLEEGNTDYQIKLGKLYVQVGRNEDAFRLLGGLVERDPNCLECWYHYGDALFAAGEYDRAIAVLQQGVGKFPDQSLRWYHLGLFLDNVARQTNDESRKKLAADCYRKSLELQPMANSRAAERFFEITGERVPPELEAKSASEIPLERRNDIHIVRATINGVEGRFVLDSGASQVTVTESAARRFKLKPTRSRVTAHTANQTIQVPVAYGNVQIGGFKLDGATVLVMPDNKDTGTDGLMGNGFLWRFDPQLDGARDRLVLRGYRVEK